VTLLAGLEDFIHDHRPHGPLTGDATEPAWNGYLLTVFTIKESSRRRQIGAEVPRRCRDAGGDRSVGVHVRLKSRPGDARSDGDPRSPERSGRLRTVPTDGHTVPDGFRANFETDTDRKTILDNEALRVKNAGVEQRALKAGQRAPNFELPDMSGNRVSLAQLRASGPLALIFYRGLW
jgi:hypothetical protein